MGLIVDQHNNDGNALSLTRNSQLNLRISNITDQGIGLSCQKSIQSLQMCLQDPGNLLTGNANGYVGGQIYFDAFNVSPSGCSFF